MSKNTSQSPLDIEPWLSLTKESLEKGETNSGVVNILSESGLETSRDSVRRFRIRHQISLPDGSSKSSRVKVSDDQGTAEVTTKADSDLPLDRLNDPDAMLEERGLDPSEWEIAGATINEWDAPVKDGGSKTFKQAKLSLKKKREGLDGILPARSDGWRPARLPYDTFVDQSSLSNRRYRMYVLVGDQQAPFHDVKLHDLFLRWLKYNYPDGGVLIGDTIDLPDLSRHRDNPDNIASANECIQAGYEILRDYVAASPRTNWIKLPGNHDERLKNYLIDKAPAAASVQRAVRSEVESLEKIGDISFWMRLDELGIDFVDPKGPYSQAQANVEDAFSVRHGSITKRQSGASGLATLEGMGYNVVVGHTHRQGVTFKTTHDMSGNPSTSYGVEAGCMCSISGKSSDGRRFPDYTEDPNWQQGFAVALVYDDGSTTIELATYRNGSLFFRNQRFS